MRMDMALPRVTRPRTETRIVQRTFVVVLLGAPMVLLAAAAAPPAAAALTLSVSLEVAAKAADTMFVTCSSVG